MKYATASIALAVAALLTGHAQAADNVGKTREQVRAELAEAQRTGDIVAGKDAAADEFTSGAFKKLNELNPAAYPAKAAVAGKTRAQVRAELAEAQRTGDIVAGGAFSQTGSGLNSLNSLAGDIRTSNANISFERAVTLTGNVTLASSGGSITLASTVPSPVLSRLHITLPIHGRSSESLSSSLQSADEDVILAANIFTTGKVECTPRESSKRQPPTSPAAA